MKAEFLYHMKPAYKRTAKPSLRAQIKNRRVRPNTGIDWLLFGVAPFVVPTANIYKKKYVE